VPSRPVKDLGEVRWDLVLRLEMRRREGEQTSLRGIIPNPRLPFG
jgi:hypothetical protein